MRTLAAFAVALLTAACEPADSGHSPQAPAPTERTASAPADADAERPGSSALEESRPPAEGRYRKAREAPASPLTAEQRRIADELEAIGYASGSQPARASGVTRHDPAAAYASLNFFTSGHAESATLMDMAGRVLHEWHYRAADAFGGPDASRADPPDRWWRRAYLLPNGDVLAIITGAGLLKIDVNSKLLWAVAIHAHHDLAFGPEGDIYLLTRRIHVIPRVNPDEPIVEDLVVVLDADGNEKRSLSILEALENSEFADLWDRERRHSGDLFHTNSIEYLDGSVADVDPAFRAGNLLISLLRQDAIAVIDPQQERVVWAHTGEYRKQHDPKILPSGNLLLFDNHGNSGPSAVLEFDPRSMDVVWEYRGSADAPFYSKTCGTAERLPNGDTLITETDFGRAFEVNAAGEIVWEFYNPHRAGNENQFIASLPEMIRLPTDFPVDWLPPTNSRSTVGDSPE